MAICTVYVIQRNIVYYAFCCYQFYITHIRIIFKRKSYFVSSLILVDGLMNYVFNAFKLTLGNIPFLKIILMYFHALYDEASNKAKYVS